MAKKSAKSKGYRKQIAKKPYLSKRDIALLCVLVAALAIGAFFLFRYDDGALKVQDGSVVAEGDNWLIVNGSSARGRARYFKLGEIGEIDGYAREAKSIATDANIPEYVFTPEAEDSGVASVTVTTSHSDAGVLANYAASLMAELEDTEVGEAQSGDLSGTPVRWFIYTTESADPEADAEAETDAGAEGGESAPSRFSKVLSGYFNASHDSCVAVHVETQADSAEDYLSDEVLTALLEQAVSAVTLESAA